MRSVSIRKQITTISIVANPLIFYFCIISTVFQLFYGKNSKKTIGSSKQAHNAKKTKSVKNITVCRNLDISNTYETPKILKNYEEMSNLYINLLQKELVFYHASVKNENYFRERKSFCFSARSNQLSPNIILKALLGTNTN